MFRRIALASTILLGAGMGAAFAQDAGPVMTGGGDNLQITYPQDGANVVGGAFATVQGGGDNEQVTTSSVTNAQRGETAVLTGSGDNMRIVYVPASPNREQVAAGAAAHRGS